MKRIRSELKCIYPDKSLTKLNFNDLFILLKNGHSVFNSREFNIHVVIIAKRFERCLDLKDFVKQFAYSSLETELMAKFYIEVLKVSKCKLLCFDNAKYDKHSLSGLILNRIYEAFRLNSFLKVLSLVKSLRDEKFNREEVIKSLTYHPSLICLDLSQNNLFSKIVNVAVAIKTFLVKNKTLLKLNLNTNRPDSESTQLIFSGLAQNTSLKQFFYSNNEISGHDCKHISDMLSINKSLVLLCLDNNQISDLGFEHLCLGLTQNNTLTRMTLQKNTFTNKIIDDIYYIFEKNKVFNQMDLSKNVNLYFTNEEKKKLSTKLFDNVITEQLFNSNKEKKTSENSDKNLESQQKLQEDYDDGFAIIVSERYRIDEQRGRGRGRDYFR